MQWRNTVSSVSGAGKTGQVGWTFYIISCRISCIFFRFYFIIIILLYNIVLVLPYINMNKLVLKM